MHPSRKPLALVSLALGLGLGASFAPLAAADMSGPSTFQTSFASSFNAANDKILQLANAFNDEQMAWRPSEGVRSTREVFIHVIQANFFLPGKLGAQPPEGVNLAELGNFAGSKDELVALLKKSMEYAGAAVKAVPETDMGKDVQFFGQTAPEMRYILILVEHAHEHLGQLIAYARSNGVVPPWSK